MTMAQNGGFSAALELIAPDCEGLAPCDFCGEADVLTECYAETPAGAAYACPDCHPVWDLHWFPGGVDLCDDCGREAPIGPVMRPDGSEADLCEDCYQEGLEG